VIAGQTTVPVDPANAIIVAATRDGLGHSSIRNFHPMSNRYIRLMDLMQRPEGCRVEEACKELRVTPAGCRGMIRDLKRMVPVTTVYLEHRGRGKGRLAVHFVHAPQTTAAG
jgi:hypothetical protein